MHSKGTATDVQITRLNIFYTGGGGRESEANEWQRSVDNEAAGGKAATGHPNRKQVDNINMN